MCSTQRWSTSSRKIEKAFLGRSEGSESCVKRIRKKGEHIKLFQPSRIFSLKLPFSKLIFEYPVASFKGMTCLLQQVDN